MNTNIKEYGKNAGKIWNALDQNGPLTENNLIKSTKLKEGEFCAAIGWLARENKVRKEKRTFMRSPIPGERIGSSRSCIRCG